MNTLFDLSHPDQPATVLARTADPPTSKLAAREIAADLPRREAWAIECVRQTPGLTAKELEARHGGGNELHKRLRQCERKQLLRNGETRACSITGPPATSTGRVTSAS